MRLITAHRILISTSVVFFVFFSLWELRNYLQDGDAWTAFRSALYLLIGIGFGIYLMNLKRWYKQRD